MTRTFQSQRIYVGISGDILRETPKAIHLSYFDTELQKNIPLWIPISQCSQIIRAAEGDVESKSILMVAEWVLEKAGCKHTPVKTPASTSSTPTPTFSVGVNRVSNRIDPDKIDDDEIPF